MLFPAKKLSLLAMAIAGVLNAAAAPVVVQKGSTAQYIYIPAGSVATGGGGGANDGATAAKQFCKLFIAKDSTLTADTNLMLDETLKVGAVLVGGGSGGNLFDNIDDGSGTPKYVYASGGGGGSTAVLINGVLGAVAPGADAAPGYLDTGLKGARVTMPEIAISRSGTAPTIKVIIGGGGGPANPGFGYSPTPRYDGHGGYGGRGYMGGGGGGKFFSATNLGAITWTSPARGGGASSGGTGAVPMYGTGRISGGAGGSLLSGSGTSPSFGRAPMTGRLTHKLDVVNGYYTVRFVRSTQNSYSGSEYNEYYYYNSNLQDGTVVQSNVWGSYSGEPISEVNMSAFGAGGRTDIYSAVSGTAGIVMLYYSAPNCTLFSIL